MPQNIKSGFKVLFALILAITGVVLVLLTGRYLGPQPVAAQGPSTGEIPVLPLSPETLAAFGFSAQDIQAANVPYDLEIVKTASVTSVTAGNPVIYTVVITNHGPSTIRGLFFKDYLPAEMPNANFSFSAADVISDYAAIPLWFIDQTLISGSHTTINVTGILTSPYSKAVSNRAEVIPFVQGEITATNNSSQVSVNIEGSSSLYFIYFPLIRKDPPVAVLVYSDDFSDSDSDWLHKEYSDSDHDCYNYYDGLKYRINANNSVCWGWAPSAAERTYGSFQVEGYISEGNSNVAWGIYSNGAGGSSQYVLRIWPNTSSCPGSGSWQLLRNGSSVGGGSGTCNAAIYPGLNVTNKLKITHLTTGAIVSFINDTPVYTYTDSSQLTGTGTGVYVNSDSPNTYNVIKFDNFQVYTLPQ